MSNTPAAELTREIKKTKNKSLFIEMVRVFFNKYYDSFRLASAFIGVWALLFNIVICLEGRGDILNYILIVVLMITTPGIYISEIYRGYLNLKKEAQNNLNK